VHQYLSFNGLIEIVFANCNKQDKIYTGTHNGRNFMRQFHSVLLARQLCLEILFTILTCFISVKHEINE